MAAIDPDEPIPDGMVWNMRYRDGARLRASRARVRRGALGSAHLVPEGACAGRRGGGREARRASRRSAGECASRHRAARQRARQVRPAALDRRQPVERARILPRLAAGDAGRRHLRNDAALRAGEEDRLRPFPQREGQGAALRRELRRRRRHRHGRDRPHPPRGGLRRRARPRSRAGACMPGAVARRPCLHGRLHARARRHVPDGASDADATRDRGRETAQRSFENTRSNESQTREDET